MSGDEPSAPARAASTDHVLLVGMMGAGKTTVGRILARRLGRPYLDSDEEVERSTGRTVPEIFVALGEPAFRREEAAALAAAVSSASPTVVAVAGGAVLDPANRELLRRAGAIVWLRARPETIVARVGSGAGRVLLQPDPSVAVPRLIAERSPLYGELATLVVDVEGRGPAEVADRVVAGLVERVEVDAPGGAYGVLVGPGARHALASLIPDRARRCVVVSQAAVDVEVEVAPGIDTLRLTMGDGEAAKSLTTVEELCRAFSRAGVTRHDVVVAVGGGVVTDVAGFAAASYHRGTDVIHVPTTLLAQVDAAIGGKTGVNLPEGKNLVGAFWQPRAVLCDTDTLVGLPAREWRSGFGEMAKYAFLGVDGLGEMGLTQQIVACVALKAAVVGSDEREHGARMLLNYGHTLAHALEAAGFAAGTGEAGVPAGSPGGAPRPVEPLRHGEAVGIGLVFAARLARRLGRVGDDAVERHLRLVARYGLPTAVPAQATVEDLVTLMGRDKKATDGLTFVLDGPDGPETVRHVEREDVEATLLECGAAGGVR